MNLVLDLSTPLLGGLFCIGCGIGWILWKKRNWQCRYWVIPVFECYALILIKLTIFPIHIFDKETLDAITAGAEKYFTFYQIIPFASIKKYFETSAMIQLIGNFALLCPLALFAEIFLRQRHKAWKVVVAVSSTSLFIEVAQLLINSITKYPARVADVDDLLLNITGIVFTIILTRCIGKLQNVRKAFQKILYR